jgi:nickel-dependent lactate racemase
MSTPEVHEASDTRQALTLPWGDDRLVLELPSAWRVGTVAAPSPSKPSGSDQELVRTALASPVGARSFARRDLSDEQVVIVVDDSSRPTPVPLLFRSVLREVLEAGATPDNIRILFSIGVHKPLTREEVIHRLGWAGALPFAWKCVDPRDPSGLVFLGKTRRRTPVYLDRWLDGPALVVLLGTIEPHVLAGFGGGLKNLVPGCAGLTTIAANHLLAADPTRFSFVGANREDNPMRADLEEAAGMVPAEVFILNVVLDERRRVVGAVAGDPIQAFDQGVELSRARAAVPLTEPADVLITNSFPMEHNLRQGMKCIGNTCMAVREGGTILAFLRCEHGLDDYRLPERSLPLPVLRTLLRLLSRDRILPLVKRVKGKEGVEEQFLAFYALQMVRRNRMLVYAPGLTAAEAGQVGLFEWFPSTDALLARAHKMHPRARVHVFPQGGVTYPVLPPPDQG